MEICYDGNHGDGFMK